MHGDKDDIECMKLLALLRLTSRSHGKEGTKDEIHILPSGSNGWMLGDIRGRRAGLTCDELVLFLEFAAVVRLGAVALCGEVATLGDGKTALDAVSGALFGAADTLLSLADIVGVASLSTWDWVLMGCRTGLLAEPSPVSIFSIICSISGSAFDDCSLSSERRKFDLASSAASF